MIDVGHSLKEVEKAVGLSRSQIRRLVVAGVVTPTTSSRGFMFSFQDIALLRSVSALVQARIPGRRIRQALLQVKNALPPGRELSSVRLHAEGSRIVVRDASGSWSPEGQVLFDFGLPARAEVRFLRRSAQNPDADEWYDLGWELEERDPSAARAAYLKAIALEPDHAHAHLNLGRLYHLDRRTAEAEHHYRVATGLARDNLAWFNLGVLLEDTGRLEEAAQAYREALKRLGEALEDATFNLAQLSERLGRKTEALRHLKDQWRRLHES